MDIANIPVRVVGPGSQAGSNAEGPAYIDMPSDMQQYDAPIMPEPEDVQHLDGAHEAMTFLKNALAAFGNDEAAPLADLTQLDEESRALVNQIIGEGEVSITYNGTPKAHVQESVLAGVWRTFYFDDDGKVAIDLLEVGYVPHIITAENKLAQPIDLSQSAETKDMTNALPLLVELDSHCRLFALDGSPHSINLTLLPLSPEELVFIDQRLGRGPVGMLSRAYGKCEVISTQCKNVWWVRYYNAMGALILNLLEVTDIPQVVAAADEDISDSATRLDELLQHYWTTSA
jgi:hydrogenase-1 operon protein HyaF